MIKEYFDALNENGEKVGKPLTYEEIHQAGLLHRAVHVWLVNTEGQILLQKRSENMTTYPGYWDISASGHVSSGQSSIEAAQIETKEELGIEPPASAFKLIFSLRERIILNEGKHIENEIRDVYLVRADDSNLSLKSDLFEITELKWVHPEEFKLWMKGERELLVPHQEEYERLLENL
jgi:isopentenyl-diphosphate delta-isomerase type 1